MEWLNNEDWKENATFETPTTILHSHSDVVERTNLLREKFTRAVDIWLKKPQVVDRRILAGINLPLDSAEPSELNRKIAEFVRNLHSDCSIGGSTSRPTTDVNHVTMKSIPTSYKVLSLDKCFCLRRLLPRQSERMKPSYELIFKDASGQEFVFLMLPKREGMFTLPNSLKTTFGYKIKLHPDGSIKLFVSPTYETEHPSSTLPVLSPPSLDWLKKVLIPKLAKWTEEIDPSKDIETKESVISLDRYSQLYGQMKKKYGPHFVEIWPENTDPLKFVYEDIAIATYLLVLWEEERARDDLEHKQSFVDLGCGNGLLVHILNSEGHPGKGIDLRRRKIWDIYGPNTHLEECSICPSDDHLFPNSDWLIGNHSDELTPWIPVMAFRSSEKLRYFVLPCCFHDFDRKFLRVDSHQPQYVSYLNFVKEVGETCGFHVLDDALRIPSTKRLCQIGAKRTYPLEDRSSIEQKIESYIRLRCRPSPSAVDKSLPSAPLPDHDNNVNTCSTNQWASSFQPRVKSEPIRNCSQLAKSLTDDIVRKIATAILDEGSSMESADDVQERASKLSKVEAVKWRKGGSLSFQKAVKLFDPSTLKQLKNECGGLKTLLKNHNQIFFIRGNTIELRDWSKQEEKQVASKSRPSGHTREELLKTKMCWFFMNHPDGCPKKSEDCSFAHGASELREKPPPISLR